LKSNSRGICRPLPGALRIETATNPQADGKVFLLDTEGGLSVVKGGRDWTTLATSDLGEKCWTTPAICDGRLFVRTDKSIYCFGT
jgi:hypothetical protein